MSKPNNCDLILELQQGSLDALGKLYDLHNKMVYRTALAITGDQDAASDLLQDVFLRLHRFADKVEPGRPLEPWLYRVTANLSYTWMKRRRWLRPIEDIAEWLAGENNDSPPQQAEKQEEWHTIEQALTKLPLPQRIVIVLYYINDFSLQEISQTLTVPVGTVKSRLHYGRQALKKAMNVQRGIVPEVQYEFT